MRKWTRTRRFHIVVLALGLKGSKEAEPNEEKAYCSLELEEGARPRGPGAERKDDAFGNHREQDGADELTNVMGLSDLCDKHV